MQLTQQRSGCGLRAQQQQQGWSRKRVTAVRAQATEVPAGNKKAIIMSCCVCICRVCQVTDPEPPIGMASSSSSNAGAFHLLFPWCINLSPNSYFSNVSVVSTITANAKRSVHSNTLHVKALQGVRVIHVSVVGVCHRPEQVQQPYHPAQEPGCLPGYVVRNR
jgi:hypothetical protein